MPNSVAVTGAGMIPTANLTLLYGSLPLEERFVAARLDGFKAVEILFPYDQEPEWYAQQLQENGLQLALINTPVDTEAARWGRAAVPGQGADFRRDLQRAARVCEATGCPAIHVMAGAVAPSEHEAGRSALLDNLSWAAAAYPGLRLQLEALNTFDVPGYFYSEPGRVADILQSMAIDSVGMQFDFYHVVRQGLDLPAELERALPWLRYVQVAGSPQRHEPRADQDGIAQAFTRLHEYGYRGHVGYEYRPAADASAGLAWAQGLSNLFSNLPAGRSAG